MSIDVKSNLNPQPLKPNQAEILMARVASVIIDENRERVQGQGLDVNGARLNPYSKKYAAYRKAHGRTESVNLTYSGRMFQSLKIVGKKIQATRASVEVGWTGEQMKKAAINQDRREFFGISKPAQKQIDAVVDQFADDMLKGNL